MKCETIKHQFVIALRYTQRIALSPASIENPGIIDKKYLL